MKTGSILFLLFLTVFCSAQNRVFNAHSSVVQIKRSDRTGHIIKAYQQKKADQTLADLFPQLIQWFEQF
jgi:hypothetical protein